MCHDVRVLKHACVLRHMHQERQRVNMTSHGLVRAIQPPHSASSSCSTKTMQPIARRWGSWSRVRSSGSRRAGPSGCRNESAPVLRSVKCEGLRRGGVRWDAGDWMFGSAPLPTCSPICSLARSLGPSHTHCARPVIAGRHGTKRERTSRRGCVRSRGHNRHSGRVRCWCSGRSSCGHSAHSSDRGSAHS